MKKRKHNIVYTVWYDYTKINYSYAKKKIFFSSSFNKNIIFCCGKVIIQWKEFLFLAYNYIFKMEECPSRLRRCDVAKDEWTDTAVSQIHRERTGENVSVTYTAGRDGKQSDIVTRVAAS